MEVNTIKWICCQLGSREHYAIPRALHSHGALEQLITDTWVTPQNPLGALKQSLRDRFNPDLTKAKVAAANFGSIAVELRTKLLRERGWTQIVSRNQWFQKMAISKLAGNLSARRVSEAPKILLAYSYAALEIIRFARVRGWLTVLGQIDPGPPEERIVSKLCREQPTLGGPWEPAPSVYWEKWREECDLADRIVVNSPWSRTALMSEGVAEAKIRVVPLAYTSPTSAINFRRTYPKNFTETRPLRILFLGQINLRKGLGPLLDATDILRDKPVEFWMVGTPQISIPTKFANHPKIRWFGPVPRSKAPSFYRDADVFLFPTFSDGFGLTQLEAQAWKLPLIVSEFCGEVVQHARNGLVLEAITGTHIAESLKLLLESPSQLQEFSKHSELEKRFSLSSIGQELLGCFS